MKTTRYRYYKLAFKISFSDLCELLRSNVFTDDMPNGFELIETSRAKLTGRYIEKHHVTEIIPHPFGRNESITTVRYTIFQFDLLNVKKGISVIKIYSPPTSLKSFVNNLSDLISNGFTISKMHFELDKLYKYITSHPQIDRYKVNMVSVSSIPFSDKSTAKLVLSSQDNAYNELKKTYKKKQYVVDKLSMKARVNGKDECIAITSAGSLSYSEGFGIIINDYVLTII